MRFLNGRHALALTVVLLVQAGAFYALASRSELVPSVAPLSTLPAAFGDWKMVLEQPLEPEVAAVLNADDTLTRVYVHGPQAQTASLFVAFFKTQRTGQAPHSPKNCLPGSGWAPVESGMQAVQVPGRAEKIVLNRYTVSRGSDQTVVLYWYQSHGRVIAREMMAKIWLVADAIRYRRSDTALVRVTVPVRNSRPDMAAETADQFVQALFPALSAHLAGAGGL
jgi:EpsI family protein